MKAGRRTREKGPWARYTATLIGAREQGASARRLRLVRELDGMTGAHRVRDQDVDPRACPALAFGHHRPSGRHRQVASAYAIGPRRVGALDLEAYPVAATPPGSSATEGALRPAATRRAARAACG